MQLTHHAQNRSIQRRLPTQILKTIHAYGTPRPSWGALSLTLDAEAIALAAEDNRRLRNELERYRGAYLIVGDSDRVITAVRQTRRFRH